jgi:hypothetical protein
MKRIQIWRVDGGDRPAAVPLDAIRNSETERMLEELLVRSPNLLQRQLQLIGRQVATAGGPLDLLGVDDEGRLVIFELKRGVLTRDAVAQVLDYASDLALMSNEGLARLIEEGSGRLGIDRIPDFLEWYAEEFPGQAGPLIEKPRMVLVGLGVDERALRMVNYLAEMGVAIELITFHAFGAGGELFLAKQVESDPIGTSAEVSTGTKAENQRVLLEKARSLGAAELLEEVRRMVEASLGTVYVWPNKSVYSFYLPAETQEGRPTQRHVVSVGPNEQRPGTVRLAFPDRVLQLDPGIEARMVADMGAQRLPSGRYALDLIITRERWTPLAQPLGEALVSIRRFWDDSRQRTDQDADDVLPLDE